MILKPLMQVIGLILLAIAGVVLVSVASPFVLLLVLAGWIGWRS